MTTPRDEQPPAPPTTGPTVSTAPPRSRWAWPRVPAHVGPARTSTVVLAVLFAGIFALYLVVRPDPATVVTGTTGGSQPTQAQQNAPRTTTPAPTTTRSTTPTRTSATSSTPTPSTGRTTSSTGGGGSATNTGSSPTPTTPPLLPTTGSAPTS